ncbi:hypothetical protein RBSWK_00689 [Rhodopirellula baltica SWK14]|uniref:Uncharacterized protein n=1 Tax=Rhodopirellula baltica SWK14 TaxID=993516 RepID=L7CNJ6_RHOBT|nr:hypothetical protein RBSWK_00689 [Rhodopirellula baltica SWK14]
MRTSRQHQPTGQRENDGFKGMNSIHGSLLWNKFIQRKPTCSLPIENAFN